MTLVVRQLSNRLQSHLREWLFYFFMVCCLTGCSREIAPLQHSGGTMVVAQAQGLAVYFISRVGDDFIHSHTAAFSVYLTQPQS